MNIKSLWLIVFLLVGLFAVETVRACSCVTVDTCLQNASADAVLVGKVINVVRKGNAAVHEVEVERQFNGLQNLDRIEIYTDQVTSCAFSMEKGEAYLIFASLWEKSGLLTTGYCSGTKRLKDAVKEIEFLDSLKNAEDRKGVLRGSVLEYDLKNKFEVKPWKPKEIDKVILESSQGEKVEKPISQDGTYSFKNLKGGWYNISFLIPERLITSEEKEGDYLFKAGFREIKENVKVPGSGCEARRSFSVMANGVITGKVVDANGKPLPRIPVTLFRHDDADDMPEENYKVWSDDNGIYVAKGIPSGRYLIGFGIDHSLYINSHFAGYLPTFYPNTTDRKKSVYIELKDSEFLKEKNLQLLTLLTKRKINGQVLLPGGTASSRARVNAYARRQGVERGDWIGELEVDTDGRFEFEAYEETKYVISAWVEESNSSGKAETKFSSDCYLIKKTGNVDPIRILVKSGSRNCKAYEIE